MRDGSHNWRLRADGDLTFGKRGRLDLRTRAEKGPADWLTQWHG
jgi:hypothetical protein